MIIQDVSIGETWVKGISELLIQNKKLKNQIEIKNQEILK